MIVQCEHCQTRYRIPDEKVKGKAAKVRCAKCDSTFTIYPDGETPAPASHGQAPPAAGAVPPAQKLPEPPEGEVDSEPEGETELPPALSPQPSVPEAETPSAGPTEESTDLTTPVQGTEATDATSETDSLLESLGGSYGSPPFPEDADPAGNKRPAHEIDRDVHRPQAEDGPSQPGPGEFEFETTVQEEISDLLQTPAGDSFSDALLPVEDEMGWGNISLDSEPDKQTDGDGIGLAEGTGYKPPPPPPPLFDEESFEESPRPEAGALTADAAAPKKARKGLLILLVLAVLGAGGYFAYPKVMEIINPHGEQPVGTLIPDKIQVRSLSREDGTLIYTVRGVVRNDSSGTVGMIQVEAQFRNTAGTVVAKSTSYCGNIFEDSEIISGDLGRVLADLQNELGQSLSNSGIQPGQELPFLIILENPPTDVSKVTVTISGFKETT